MIGVQFNAGASRKAIREAIALLTDMTPVYQEIGDYLTQQHRQRFVDAEDPEGKPWAAKSEATLARYKQLGYGSLSRPLTGPSKRLSSEIQQFVSRDGVVIGSSLIYSWVMQDGAAKGAFGTDSKGRSLPWGRIPACKWLGMSEQNDSDVIDIVDKALAAKLEQEG